MHKLFVIRFFVSQQIQNNMKTNLKSLLASANVALVSCSVAEAKEKLNDKSYAFIDVREKQELESEGQIPGAINIPRGMLEFQLDANSPYYNHVFDEDKSFVFYCKSGGRSALAAHRAVEMGLNNVVNMAGGFLEWNK